MTHDESRIDFVTADIEEAHDVLTRLYAGHGMRLRRPARDFQFRQEAIKAGPMMAGHLHYRMDVDLLVEPLDDLLFAAVVDGRLETRVGLDGLQAVRGDVLLNRNGLPLMNRCDGADVHTLTLDRRMVAEWAAGSTGIDPADFRFEGIGPVSPAMGVHWRSTMAYVHRVYSGPADVLRNALVVRTVADVAVAGALAAFANTAMGQTHPPGPGPVTPAAVRRAVAYIDEHAGEPITVARIAEVARVGPRALQSSFRRHLGVTPIGYLRRVRLDRAHRDLASADPGRGDTVTMIAHRWGWASVSRFAAEYGATYGRPPSHTLRN
jgi:AraC-like DNA-binding protein